MKNDWAKWLRCDVLKCLVGFNGWKERCCLFMYKALSVKDCRSPKEMYLTNIFYRLLSQCLKETIFAHLLYPSNCSATCKTASLNDEGREKNCFDASQAGSSVNVNTQKYLRGSKTSWKRYFEGIFFLMFWKMLWVSGCSGCLFPVCWCLLLPWVILGKYLPLVWLLYSSAALARS